MSLGYILRRVEAEAGFSAPDLNPETRDYLLDIINEAARQIYTKTDLPISLEECYIRTSTEAELALPPFVGELRGIRSCEWNDNWTINDLRPRYSQAEWPTIWKTWREKKPSPLKIDSDNLANLTIQIPEADSTVIVSIVGESLDSNNVRESITMDATEKTGTKNYTSIKAIRKNKVTDYNITILDGDDEEISVIYADQLEARYKIVDVSEYPNLRECSDGTYSMEVLFKPRLPRLIDEQDAFPVDGWDDVIVAKTIELLEAGKEGHEQRAMMVKAAVKELTDDIVNDKTEHLSKKLGFKANPLHSVYKRRGYWRRP
jgi:hypothetical protein